MQDEKKVYGRISIPPEKYYYVFLQPGFTISLYEFMETIPTLWDAVKGDSNIRPVFDCLAQGDSRVYEREPRRDSER
jgi:hypothetical protein